ncbi:YciI family protein [Kitasatospora sp. LaBMicrA B282]|uniref:YciI family protein n=1 Tax=Kitasatospora sp. LaBMicrA B282 TaxID=3420949 RepID=UPI003D0C814E
MQFALLMFGQETDWDAMTAEEREERFTANREFARALVAAGVEIVYGARLGRPTVAEGEERAGEGVLELGGLWVVEVPSEQEALGWAARMPIGPAGRVEVRRCERGPRRPAGEGN